MAGGIGAITVGGFVHRIVGPATIGLIVRGIGPIPGQRIERGGQVGATDLVLKQVVIAGFEPVGCVVIIVGIIMPDKGRAATVGCVVLFGLAGEQDDITGRVGGRTTGRVAGCVIGVAILRSVAVGGIR